MLEVKNVSFFYEKKRGFCRSKTKIPIFENLNFSLEKKENLLIYGSSGSGKSTLGKIMAGILETQVGEIRIDGQKLVGLTPHKIQYVFQDQKTALNPYKTIEYLIKDIGVGMNINKYLEDFSLGEHVLKLKACALSRGEAQRIGLLRALLLRPSILICDELVDSLDLSLSRQILATLKKYQEDNEITYIFISHTKEVLEGMYQKVLYL